MAIALAEVAGVPEAITRFALLGDERCPDSYGACRNTLLLLTAGQLTMQIDDDTVCRIAKAPWQQGGLLFSPKQDANAYAYFADEASAMAATSFIDTDLLAIHEALLGKPVAEIAAAHQQVDFSEVDESFMARMSLTDARVASTFMGTVGDSGMYGNTFRLFDTGASYKVTMDSEAAFIEKMTTRWIAKAATRTTISAGAFCMTINAGLDNRTLLPPFMPVMRNEDGVWGAVRTVCFPQYFSGYQPYVMAHLPPVSRAAHALEDCIVSKGPRTNDLMSQLIWHLGVSAPSLPALGEALHRLGCLPAPEFQNLLNEVANATRERIISHVDFCLDTYPDPVPHWQDAMLTYRQSLAAAKNKDTFPIDLIEQPLQTFQDLVSMYGQLLTYWPRMIEGGKSMKGY